MPQSRASLARRAQNALDEARQIQLISATNARKVLVHCRLALNYVAEIEAAFSLSAVLLELRDDVLALVIQANRRLDPWGGLGKVNNDKSRCL